MDENITTIEKTMALTRADFDRSLAKIKAGSAASTADAPVHIAYGNGKVTISFKPLPSETVGGLLTLPRARVLLVIDGLSAEQKAAFLTNFDRAFQRGGG